MSSRHRYSVQYKREAVAMIAAQGLSVAEAARRLGLSQGLLRQWKIKFEQGCLDMVSGTAPTTLEAEVQELREQVRRLAMERDILKKAATFFAKELR
jgi:transposase